MIEIGFRLSLIILAAFAFIVMVMAICYLAGRYYERTLLHKEVKKK